MNDFEFLDRIWADWSPGLDASEAIVPVKAALADAPTSAPPSATTATHSVACTATRLQADKAQACRCHRIPRCISTA